MTLEDNCRLRRPELCEALFLESIYFQYLVNLTIDKHKWGQFLRQSWWPWNLIWYPETHGIWFLYINVEGLARCSWTLSHECLILPVSRCSCHSLIFIIDLTLRNLTGTHCITSPSVLKKQSGGNLLFLKCDVIKYFIISHDTHRISPSHNNTHSWSIHLSAWT